MKVTEELILKYLDGDLNEEEANRLMISIEDDRNLKKIFKRHKAIHQALLDDPVVSPSPGFAENVMQKVRLVKQGEGKFFNRLRILVMLLIVFILATSLYYLGVNFYPTMGGIVSEEITLQEFTMNMKPAKDVLNSDVIFKIVLYVNGIIGLILLDRALLKPYFAKRRERFSM